MRAMFHTVAPRYNFITRAFSYGMDGRWKRSGVELAQLPDRPVVLDLASGTGDFSLLVRSHYPDSQTLTVDITERMLRFARARGLPYAVCADAGVLPFRDSAFDCVFIGYGLRNFPNLNRALEEIERVTRPGGMLVSLDFFLPGESPYYGSCISPTSTPRARSGDSCFTGGRGFTHIYPIRCEPLSRSTGFRRCWGAPAIVCWPSTRTFLAGLVSIGRLRKVLKLARSGGNGSVHERTAQGFRLSFHRGVPRIASRDHLVLYW